MQMLDPVLLSKGDSIERSIARARGVLASSSDFLTDIDAQDICVLNITRASESCIDAALRLLKLLSLELPTTSSDSFLILAKAHVIDQELAQRLVKMVGFRNVAVHQHAKLNYDIAVSVAQNDLTDVLKFAGIALLAGTSKT